MQFQITKQQLNEAMATALKAIDAHVVIPILTNIKLDVKPQEITITSSNADLTIVQHLQPETNHDKKDDEKEASSEPDFAYTTADKPIALTLPARFLSRIVKTLTEDMITFTIPEDGTQAVTLTSGKAQVKIPYLPAQDYPHLPEPDDDATSAQISAQDMQTAIKQDLFAVSTSETRPILTGINFYFNKDNELTSVATDSHRLSQSKLSIIKADSQFKQDSYIIPAETMKQISSLISKLDENAPISLTHVGDNFCLQFSNYTVYTRLLLGDYPDTSRLIPQTSNLTMTIDRTEMLNAINRAMITADSGKYKVVKLTIDPTGKTPTVLSTASTPDSHASTKEELTNCRINAQDNNDETFEITFNPEYIKDALKAFDDNTVIFSFTSVLRPFTITGASDKDKQFIHLVTPIRTF